VPTESQQRQIDEKTLKAAQNEVAASRKRKRDETTRKIQEHPQLIAATDELTGANIELRTEVDRLRQLIADNAADQPELARLTEENENLARQLRNVTAGRDLMRRLLHDERNAPSERSSQASDALSDDGHEDRRRIQELRRAAAAESAADRLQRQARRGDPSPVIIQVAAAAPVFPQPAPQDQWANRLSNHHAFRVDNDRIQYKSKNRDVTNDGARKEEQHWDQDDKLVSKPPVGTKMKNLFYSMGGRITDEGDAVIKRGNNQRRFADAEFIQDEEMTRRPNSPALSDHEWKFGRKVYYDVQFQDNDDAMAQGMKAEYRREPSANQWKNNPRFRGRNMLMYCQDVEVDRRSLASRWVALDIESGRPLSREDSIQLHEDHARDHRDRSRSGSVR
jgi:hypothetical protein